jgi:hypothetical protein
MDELRAVIGLLIYGGVFESSHEHTESLYKMDGTGGLVFPVAMAKKKKSFPVSLVSYVPKKNKSAVLFSSLHHDSAICTDSGKSEIIEFCNKTKGAVDMLDKMYARYTVQRETRRWAMAVFYGTINIAAVNALDIYAHNMSKDQPEKRTKRKDFCSELHRIW